MAAAAGFTVRDGAKDADFQAELARWYATPSPAVLPDAGGGRANLFGVRDLHGLVWEWTSDFNSALVTGDARGDTGRVHPGAGAGLQHLDGVEMLFPKRGAAATLRPCKRVYIVNLLRSYW